LILANKMENWQRFANYPYPRCGKGETQH
jgi:hypothetical protein